MQTFRALRILLVLLGIALTTSACFVIVDPGRGYHHRYPRYNQY